MFGARLLKPTTNTIQCATTVEKVTLFVTPIRNRKYESNQKIYNATIWNNTKLFQKSIVQRLLGS